MKRVFALFAALLLLSALPARASAAPVVVVTLDGVIDPISDNYISKAIDRAAAERATGLVLAMDTPGGLDTSMRHIIKQMLAAPLPVIVYVSPSGARAASAGLYITQAADVAAMAPGTNIGSAHPVSIGGSNPTVNPSASPATDIESIKVENDAVGYIRSLATMHHRNADWAEKAVRQSINVPVDEAVKLGVVDLQARDLSSLLDQLQGRQVVKDKQTYTLQTLNAPIERIDMNDFERLMQALVDPNVAYLLMLLAIIGIGFWVTHPGFILPGVVGVIAAMLAGLALFNLPVNLAGILLIVVALVLFIVDLKAVTHGVLTTGGIVAMVLGGLLLIDTGFLSEGINLALLLITVLLVAGSFAFILRKVVAARRRPVAAGEESMLSKVGRVRQPLEPEGMVFVDGALWRAVSLAGPVPVGEAVRVVGIEGLQLKVEPIGEPAARAEKQPAT